MSGDMEKLSIEQLFELLESSKKSVVNEIQRLIHEKLSEGKDCSWLVNGLYDYYITTESPNGLKLLLNIKEPLDTIVCDRLSDGLRNADPKVRTRAVKVFGFIVRKQPTWLHRIAHHSCFKDLLKLIRQEGDLLLVVTSLMALTALIPAIPVKVSGQLQDYFELFGRVVSLKYTHETKKDPRALHLQIAIHSYFHRLYGMFPCNFLSWLRQQYPETGKDTAVFNSVVSPLLATVRMHPSLVTHSKDYEKTSTRWKGIGEVQEVIAECSRYSLNDDLKEMAPTQTDEKWNSQLAEYLNLGTEAASIEAAVLASIQSGWSPGLKLLNLPTTGSEPSDTAVFGVLPTATAAQNRGRPTLEKITTSGVRLMDSPPEAAIEATPENTPFPTPVKDEGSGNNARLSRTAAALSSQVVRQLQMAGSPGPASPSKLNVHQPTTPGAKEQSPFNWPCAVERRDSIFGDVANSIPGQIGSKRESAGLGLSRDFGKLKSVSSLPLGATSASQSGPASANPQQSYSELQAAHQQKDRTRFDGDRDQNGGQTSSRANGGESAVSSSGLPDARPSPVKFSKDPLPTSVIRPQAERPTSRYPLEQLLEAGGEASASVNDFIIPPGNGLDSSNLEDTEVSSLTDSVTSLPPGGSASTAGNDSVNANTGGVGSYLALGPRHSLETRHITPHIFPPSSASSASNTPQSVSTSHTTTPHPGSGIDQDSGHGSNTPFSAISPYPKNRKESSREDSVGPEDQIREARDPPTRSAVKNFSSSQCAKGQQMMAAFVRDATKRVRYMTLCEPDQMKDLAEGDGGLHVANSDHFVGLRRAVSMPDIPEQFKKDFHLQSSRGKEIKVKQADRVATDADTHDAVNESPDPVDCRSSAFKFMSAARMIANMGTQTDWNLLCLPYEHLLPAVLPASFNNNANNHKSSAANNISNSVSERETFEDPNALLDQYISSVISSLDKSGTTTVMRDELALLHCHLLYERQRREILGARNRRLLGKTKNFRELEEQNLALSDQLMMAREEINTLHTQLTKVRNEKHTAETEWSTSAVSQEQRILLLQKEKEDLKVSLRMVQDSLKDAEDRLESQQEEGKRTKAELFQANAKLDQYRMKEEKWKEMERDLDRCKKQMLLQGELLKKYREDEEARTTSASDQQVQMLLEATQREAASVKAELQAKTTELSVTQANMSQKGEELERLKTCLDMQKTFLQNAHGEMKCQVKTMEERYASLRAVNSHLESTVLELQERLERLTKSGSRKGGHRKGVSPSSDSLDVAMGAAALRSSGSSVAGSFGSDSGDHIRRTVEGRHAPINLEREATDRQLSPEVGSAQSALHREFLEAGNVSDPGSQNGGKH